ncbi:Purine nucleoside permease [Penicillium cataractarum]|uniref:Purine nucleoside permease n=1 Tax=Penicillium cataractarum TaxID=2100454 RepID=A0A9W9RB15_9EURO|nr:Purine nucleoside permease [Penicillium cataractarum]KAJ5355519.1 Purine nucleoside permease [Penicillium cataractarum]
MLSMQTLFTSLLLAGSTFSAQVAAKTASHNGEKIAPKVFIVSMFEPEAQAWWNIPEFDLLSHNITIPGLSPLYPDVHCTKDYEVCQLITGEAEINAAATVTTVAFSPLFDLTKTYFFVAGIAGINPKRATTGSATFARYAVQVALQYEIDIRELSSNYSTGYIPLGADYPDQYPTSIYGTEVFEVNANLRTIAANFARRANLSDSTAAKVYRANYANASAEYKAATLAPSVVECDVATSDVYYSGNILGTAFENTTKLFTNGTGDYCSTAQEDNATLEVLLRAAVHKLTDFSRIIVMRTASDFDRPYPGASATYNLLYSDQGGFEPALENIYHAGIEVVQGILQGWEKTFKKGVKATNYIGDIFGTLGGQPDFGPGTAQALEESGAYKKRSLESRLRRRG